MVEEELEEQTQSWADLVEEELDPTPDFPPASAPSPPPSPTPSPPAEDKNSECTLEAAMRLTIWWSSNGYLNLWEKDPYDLPQVNDDGRTHSITSKCTTPSRGSRLRYVETIEPEELPLPSPAPPSPSPVRKAVYTESRTTSPQEPPTNVAGHSDSSEDSAEDPDHACLEPVYTETTVVPREETVYTENPEPRNRPGELLEWADATNSAPRSRHRTPFLHRAAIALSHATILLAMRRPWGEIFDPFLWIF